MSSSNIKWIGNIFGAIGVIIGIILIFTKVETITGVKEFSTFNIALGFYSILTAALTCEICHWMGWMLDYSREKVGLLNEVIDELKQIKKLNK